MLKGLQITKFDLILYGYKGHGFDSLGKILKKECPKGPSQQSLRTFGIGYFSSDLRWYIAIDIPKHFYLAYKFPDNQKFGAQKI